MAWQLPSVAYLWPALAAGAAGDAMTAFARELASLALASGARGRMPSWTTRNRVALELATVCLRDFSTASAGGPAAPATLVCAPFSLHGATVVDFASGHSLVAALMAGGLKRVFVTDWRSADAEMRFLSVDAYLADLNVLVDELGGPVDLIGLCQGGWMALAYAARFPAKVRKLVLAGAPVDIAAEESKLSRMARQTPLSVFRDVVALGDGRMLGRYALQFWGPALADAAAVGEILQTPKATDPARLGRLEARFRAWSAWTLDLPGSYYLDVVERLFKRNELAAGRFVALGRRIDLSTLCIPIFLLAARDDALVAPAQIFATAHLVGAPPHRVRTAIAPCSHLGLFMGQRILNETWPPVVRWLTEPVVDEHTMAEQCGRAARTANPPPTAAASAAAPRR